MNSKRARDRQTERGRIKETKRWSGKKERKTIQQTNREEEETKQTKLKKEIKKERKK